MSTSLLIPFPPAEAARSIFVYQGNIQRADALCRAGRREEAVDLVVQAELDFTCPLPMKLGPVRAFTRATVRRMSASASACPLDGLRSPAENGVKTR